MVEAILQRAHDRGDAEEMVWCCWVLADYFQNRDEPADTVAFTEETLALCRMLEDEFYIAHILLGVATSYRRQNQFDREMALLEESVLIRRRIGDHYSLSFSLFLMGVRMVDNVRLAEAETYLDQALELHIEGKPISLATAYKAALTFWRGEFETVAQLLQKEVDDGPGREWQIIKAFNLPVMSFVQSVMGNSARGLSLCQQALHNFNLPFSHWGLALAHCGLGNDNAADQSLQLTLERATFFSADRCMNRSVCR